MKLKFKLSIIVIAILLVVVGGLSLVILTQASSMITNLSINSIERLASQQASYWKGREEGYLRIASVAGGFMGNYEQIELEIRRAQFDHFLEATLHAEPNLVGIFAIFNPNVLDGLDDQYRGAPGHTPEGIYAPWFTKTTGQIEKQTYDNVPAALNIINGPNGRKPAMKDPEPETINGKATYTFRIATPIINNRTNQVVGMVGVIIQIGAIQPIVEQIIKENTDISVMSVYTDNATIIGSYQPDRIGKRLREADDSLYNPYTDTAEDAVIRNKLVRLRVFSQVLNTNVELVLYPFTIGETGATWSVMIGTTEAMILKDVRTLTSIVLIIALVVSIAVALILFFILSAAAKPIVHVATTLKDISEGEGDLTKSIGVSGNDEIADLATYFNKTLAKIKGLVIIIKQQSASLFDIGNELATNMTETAAAINEIATSIQGVKERVINQSASVTETNATMEQITLNINRLNDTVDKQSSSVSKSSSAIEEMIANINAVTQTLAKNTQSVQELLEASDVGRTGLQEVAADIHEIARESEGLLEINAVMENIAGQTNLLSMNAAIEAAHAGEAGKGFAVVADEIRKLAESSSEQSKTIGMVLKKIKESIDKIIQSTENVMNKFTAIDNGVKLVSEQVENIRTAMEEQSVGSRQILEVMGQLNQLTRMVKDGSDEMLEGSKQIIVEGRNLEQVTEEISNGMNEMVTGADQINVAVSRINVISGQNKENIDILVKEVARFKVE